MSALSGNWVSLKEQQLTNSLLYLMSFLDRVNIGAAKLYGFMDDLNLTSHQYTIASMIFVSNSVTTHRRSSVPHRAPLTCSSSPTSCSRFRQT